MNIINSFYWKFLERICSQVFNFFVQILLARLIEPTEFGNLAIILSLINVSAIFIQSGVSTLIVIKKDLCDEDISTILLSSLGFALLGYLVLYWAAPWIEDYYELNELTVYIRELSIVLFFYAINTVFAGLLERDMQFKTFFFRSVVAVPIAGFVGIWMAYAGFGIYALITQTVLNQFLLCIILVLSNKKKRKILCFSFSKALVFYKFCTPIILQSLTGELINTIKTLTISKIYSAEKLAYYDKGSTYSNYIFQGINVPIMHVLLPTFSIYQDSKATLKNIYLRIMKVNNMFSLPIILGFAAVSKCFILCFLTDKWICVTDYIIVFCLIRAMYVAINLNIQILYVLKESFLVFKMSLITNSVSLLFLIVMCDISPLAIAIGELMATIIFWLCTIICIKRILGLSFFEQLDCYWKSVFGVSVVFIITYFIGEAQMNKNIICLITQVTFGILAYILYSFILQRKELMYIINYLNKFLKKGK